MPDLIGLCPVHSDVFYVPHGGQCPEPGCPHELVEFVPRAPAQAIADKLDELRSRILHMVGKRRTSDDFDGATR